MLMVLYFVLYASQWDKKRHNQNHVSGITAGMLKMGRKQQLGRAKLTIKTVQVCKSLS